ncbi:restriction endonuclease subunit S [Cyclobacterium qasimii]|uniref:Type I restriction-modification system, specificity subunit S n=2 Tax=Cyclobacterium qasimii TaxID=1350429 RepID=S7V7V2_9BACT|nr:restriction endonuclease subunit S [Cyclobacterium qasimii]EPR65652.1 Type I restriction-modification system, specificity subunit S [Cyclobacterium qasimii M12-11B]GEO20170.1 putative type-1 restriction enzyme HindVIIP specificity protein [Cyclobacterium qasimii]
MSEWKELKLVDCTINGNISYGIVQPGQDDRYGVPIIRVNNFKNGMLDTDSVLKVESNIEAKHSKTRLKGGEVLLTLVGSTGQTAIVPEKLKGWNVARAVAVIRVKPEIGAKWINLWLRSSKASQHLNSRANTTVQKTLNLKDVKSIPISIPPESERKSVEHIIFSIDDKIELNRQMNQTLEAMAQALFKSWFVDFDPVMDNALAAGNDIPEGLQEMAEKRALVPHSKKLISKSPELAKEFPSSFVYNETLGKWIPEGWEVKTIGVITAKVTDGTHSTVKDDPDGNCFLLSCKNIKNGQILITENDRKINSQTLQQLRKRTGLQINDVLLTTVGTIGEVALVTKVPNNYELQRSVAIIRGDDSKVLHHFLHQYIKSKFFQNEALNRSKGSVQTCLFLGAINSVPVLMPTYKIIESFQNNIESSHLKIVLNQEQSKTLTKLRDSLLPELISGRVRVQDEIIK